MLDGGRFVLGMTRLVAVPNVSEGRDEAVLDAIGAAFATHADVLHRSADADHHRAVFFLAGAPGELHLRARRRRRGGRRADRPARATTGCTRASARSTSRPVVFLEEARARRGDRRGAARRRRDRRGRHPRLPLRRAGRRAHARGAAPRRAGGPRRARAPPPDYGPPALHPTAGATLVSARPPLIAFNLELAPPATLDDARRIAALIREGGERGCPACARSGLHLERRDVVQVSTNIEDHRAVTAAAVLAAVRAPPRGPRAPSSSRRRPRPRSPAGPADVELRMPATIEALLGR